MINGIWAKRWQGSSLRGLKRLVSYHCAIILDSAEKDWSPKPFRFINAWLTHPNFKGVVEDSWKEEGINGWDSYVFKEKMKRLKEKLKIWNKECFGNIN